MTKEQLEKEVEDKGVEYANKQEPTPSIHEDNGYSWGQVEEAYERGALDFSEPREKQLIEAKEILQVVLDKWKEERWILQSEEEVRMIGRLMKQAEQFLKDSEVEK